MANHTVTLAKLEQAVTHSLGGTPDVNLDIDEIINDALHYLVNLRPWHWRQRALSLDSVNAQSYIALPLDFAQILTIKKAGDANNLVKPVSLDVLIQQRQTGAASIAELYYALSAQPQASLTAEPTQIVELYPTPTATTVGFLVGTYIRQVPKLTGSTSLPDIPAYLHPSLRVLCRAMAVSNEEQQEGSDWALFERMIAPLMVEDGQATGYLGRARGGLAPPRPMSLGNNTRQIGGP